MPTISLVTASFVTRELGYGTMSEWSEGDTATQEFFAPVDTFPERFDALLDDVADLGYRTIDRWGAHLHYEWATPSHFAAARDSLDGHRMEVNSLAAWCDTIEALEGFCSVANEVGATIIGGGSPTLMAQRTDALAVLAAHDVRFAIENHPERTPAEVLAVIGDSEWLGSCADTGWWTIQGFDPPTAIRELSDHIFTVHLKDVDGATGSGMRPGSGSANLAGCLDALAKIGYDGAVGIEHEPNGWDPRDDLRAGYELLEAWVATA
jgi:L-ribulose-5-phosphate 3-epimerase